MAGERARLRATFDEAALLYGFFEEAQRIYEREAPEIVRPDDYKGPPRPDEVPTRTPEIEGSGLFEVSTTRRYRWDETYDAAGYLRVLNTYPGPGA